jgi:hypothetical protein
MSRPFRDVRAMRSHFVWQSIGSKQRISGVTSPLTSVEEESVRGQSSEDAEMLLARKSGPVRSIIAPQYAARDARRPTSDRSRGGASERAGSMSGGGACGGAPMLIPSLAVQPASPLTTAEPTRESQFVCW